MSEAEQSLRARAEPRSNSGGDLKDSSSIQLRQYPSWIKWICMIVCMSSGTFCSIVFKWQNKQVVRNCENCEEGKFAGALFQTQMMFVGESISYAVYMIDGYFSRRANKALMFDFAKTTTYYDAPVLSCWLFILCSFFDFGGTLMMMVALKLTYASTVQMLRNLMIVTAAILQPTVLSKAVKYHEVIGIILITVAMILTAVPAITTPDPTAHASTRDTVLGVILAMVGTATQTVHIILEELFMRKGRSSAMRSVGWEGIGGFVTCMVAWPICQKVGLENITGSWYAATHNKLVGITTLIYLPCCCMFNVSGYATTILGSGLLRGVCYAVRSPLVWIISLIIKWQDYEHWSLASALVFCFGFAIYVNFTGFPYGSSTHRWLSTYAHSCCTDPKWDLPYDQEEHANMPQV